MPTGGGFCYLNNAAILAKFLQEHGKRKIMIIDWDAHHGDGTESIFYEDSSVLYTSIHQSPLYPGTGKVTDTGAGDGEGFTINIPVPARTGHDTYRKIFEKIIIPAGRVFSPDAVIISAGQDSHLGDPLTDLNLRTGSYHVMTRMILEKISTQVISVLEGGYNIENLSAANYAIVCALRGEEKPLYIKKQKEPKSAGKALGKAISIGSMDGFRSLLWSRGVSAQLSKVISLIFSALANILLSFFILCPHHPINSIERFSEISHINRLC